MTTIPRDCSETLAQLVSRGLLTAERDDGALGRPNVYRPTPQLLQAFGVQTLEELRDRMGIMKPPGAADLWIAEQVPDAGAVAVGRIRLNSADLPDRGQPPAVQGEPPPAAPADRARTKSTR